MSTQITPEISEKNDYWISKHRFYELQHFCRQYPEWKKLYSKLESDLLPKCVSDREKIKLSQTSNPTERIAILRARYKEKMELVERTANEVDSELAHYILIGVTEGVTYSCLYSKHNIPCSRPTYYDRYRKFFWLLSQYRD